MANEFHWQSRPRGLLRKTKRPHAGLRRQANPERTNHWLACRLASGGVVRACAMKNFKVQHPSIRKAPSTNIQAPEKLQSPNSKNRVWNLVFIWCLEVGA